MIFKVLSFPERSLLFVYNFKCNFPFVSISYFYFPFISTFPFKGTLIFRYFSFQDPYCNSYTILSTIFHLWVLIEYWVLLISIFCCKYLYTVSFSSTFIYRTFTAIHIQLQAKYFISTFYFQFLFLSTYALLISQTLLFSEPTLQFIWTAGRKCNYRGCNSPQLQPIIRNGWFWSLNYQDIISIPDTANRSLCPFCSWGHTGALKRPQPDNRQGILKGEDEGCLAILNNLYKDGLKWHDVECRHYKPIICQRRFWKKKAFTW